MCCFVNISPNLGQTGCSHEIAAPAHDCTWLAGECPDCRREFAGEGVSQFAEMENGWKME